MVSINNSSRSYGSNGMLGLATGMDTESIIESMLSGTQAKIDKQNGLKQQTLWKQDIYRSVITQFHNLQKSFLDVLNPKSNLSSSSLFQSKTVNFTSNAIKVTASGTATQLKINEIKQLASGSKVVSNGTASGDLKLEIDASKLQDGASLDFTVDGVKKSFTLSGNNAEEIRANLNTDLQKSFGSALSIASDGSVSVAGNRHVTIGGNAEGLQTIGFSSEKSNKISLSTSIKNLNFDTPLAGDRFAFSINGTEFSFSSSQSLNDIMRTINNSDAGVKLSYSTLDDKFTLESTTLGSGVGIEIKESEGNLLSSM
ncbi:MAG: flagellar cap protein FliD N-terminal domain-containing protein, partial [Erysipelotrichaceae bacterium]